MDEKHKQNTQINKYYHRHDIITLSQTEQWCKYQNHWALLPGKICHLLINYKNYIPYKIKCCHFGYLNLWVWFLNKFRRSRISTKTNILYKTLYHTLFRLLKTWDRRIQQPLSGYDTVVVSSYPMFPGVWIKCDIGFCTEYIFW